jgi:hypothetical protein
MITYIYSGAAGRMEAFEGNVRKWLVLMSMHINLLFINYTHQYFV